MTSVPPPKSTAKISAEKTRLANDDADGGDVEGPDGSVQHFSAKTKIWAAGVRASPLAKMLADATGAECDRAARIKVRPDCSLLGHPEVFVVGDMMNYNDLPGVAEVALQSGVHAAHVIRNRVRKAETPPPWQYWDLGSMAAVDRRNAIVSLHGVQFSGRIVWLVVHITVLTGFKNRFTAVVHWFLCFVGTGRSGRAIAVNLDRLLALDRRCSGGLAGDNASGQWPATAQYSATHSPIENEQHGNPPPRRPRERI